MPRTDSHRITDAAGCCPSELHLFTPEQRIKLQDLVGWAALVSLGQDTRHGPDLGARVASAQQREAQGADESMVWST